MEGTSGHRRSLLFGTLLIGALAVSCAETAVAPDREPPPATPGDQLGDQTESVGVIVSEDEIILGGHLFGPQNEVGVILSHMRPNDQRAWFDFAQELADEGYAAFTFDFRGYGETGGDKDFGKLDEDLSEALRYMRRDRGLDTIFLIGASMGGSASLVVAAEQEVDGVVALSAPAKFEDQDALSAVPRITAPTLFIASEEDAAAVVSLDELVSEAGPQSEVETYPGNAHGTNLFQSEHAAAVRERVLRFLREHGGP